MRTKIGKRIGPVPIALVAVLALAAFISAGLWLAPSGVQAQETIDDVVLDVNEGTTINTAPAFTLTVPTGGNTLYTIASDQEESPAATGSADTNGQIEPGTGFTIGSGDGVITITSAFTTQALADQSDSTTTVTVTAQARDSSNANVGVPQKATFDLSIIQNPLEIHGEAVKTPSALSASTIDTSCKVYTSGSTAEVRVRRSATADASDGISFAERIQLTSDDASDPIVANLELSGGDCNTSMASLDVAFENMADNADSRVLVYATGGDSFTGANFMPRIGKRGLSRYVVDMESADALSTKDEGKVPVSRDMADPSGVVYLIGYGPETASGTAGSTAEGTIASTGSTFADDPTFVVKVVFASDAVEATKNPDGTYTKGSRLFIGGTSGPAANSDIPATSTKAYVRAVIKDANGTAMTVGSVEFTLPADSAYRFDSSDRVNAIVAVGADGSANATITGLPKNDALKVPVTATYSANQLEMTGNIARKGDAATVEAKAYKCETATTCAAGIAALATPATADDPKEVVSLATTDAFFITGTAKDSLGNTTSSKAKLHWKAKAAADLSAFDPDRGRGHSTINIEDNATPGTYTLVVEDEDRNASTEVTIIVAGEAAVLELSGPAMIDGTTGVAEFTLTVTDMDGNPPAGDLPAVRVVARSEGTASVSGLDKDDNAVWGNDNMATFTVVIPTTATQGSSVTILATGEGMSDTLTVTYGETPVEPDPSPVLTAPTGLEASYVALAGTISLSWTPGEAASRQMVVVLDVGGNVVFNETKTADTSVADIRSDNSGNSLLSGEYTVYVLSISGTDFKYTSVSVTVPTS